MPKIVAIYVRLLKEIYIFDMKIIIDKLSVFLPAFNEEENIKKTTLNVKNVLKEISESWEIIVVDDGSTDNTSELVKDLSKKDKRIRLVRHSKNKGYGGALKTGFKSAKYPWVVFLDSDGQFDFSEVKKFIEKSKGVDLVLGYRLKRSDSLSRKLFTWGWNLFPKIILGLKARDYSCGFKMIRKKVFDDIQPLVGEEKVTQIEMLVKAQRKGYKFAEVGVSHYPRMGGKATGANIKVVIKSMRDLLSLWKKLRKNDK